MTGRLSGPRRAVRFHGLAALRTDVRHRPTLLYGLGIGRQAPVNPGLAAAAQRVSSVPLAAGY